MYFIASVIWSKSNRRGCTASPAVIASDVPTPSNTLRHAIAVERNSFTISPSLFPGAGADDGGRVQPSSEKYCDWQQDRDYLFSMCKVFERSIRVGANSSACGVLRGRRCCLAELTRG